jgi:hypothetical protein
MLGIWIRPHEVKCPSAARLFTSSILLASDGDLMASVKLDAVKRNDGGVLKRTNVGGNFQSLGCHP